MSDGFKLPKLDLSGVTFKHGPLVNTSEEVTRKAYREVQRAHEARDKRDNKNTELLEEINTKLGGLDEIIRLLVQSTSHQKEILELLNEIFSIGTAPDEETALNRYEKVEGKINKLAELYESAKSLLEFAKYVYAMIKIESS